MIANVSEKYIKEFGLVPGFKAGLHYGKVTTGEIGVVKKEIIFTGDLLILLQEYKTPVILMMLIF